MRSRIKRLLAGSPLILIALGLILGTATTAAALSITGAAPAQISMFSGETTNSDFDLQTLDTKVKGKAKVDVTVELKNTASTTESANVTVQLLNGNDTVITQKTKHTGNISSGDTYKDRFTFQETNLTEQYDETFVIVDQDT